MSYKYEIHIGSIVLGTDDMELCRLLGYEAPYTGETRCRPCMGFVRARTAEIATALSEGLTGEAAILRAIAIVHAGRTDTSARMAAEIADKRLHAARVERQAAILRARAAGVSAAEVENIVR